MKKSYKGFVIYLLVVIFGAFACSDAIVNTVIDEQHSLDASLQKEGGKIITNAKDAGKVTLTGVVPKDKLNDSIIYVDDDGTKALPCKLRKVVYWSFRYFTPKAGKYLGIWPFDKRVENTTRFIEIKSKWGFSKYFHPNGYQEQYFDVALDTVGFTRNDITCGVKVNTYIGKIDTYGNVYGYYLDEPDLHNIAINSFNDVNDYIDDNTNSKFVTGDMKPVYCLAPYVNIADYVMCTKYGNGMWLGFCVYAWSGDDQRTLWSSFKDRYHSKNNSNWINAYKDLGSFNGLLGHANYLGQNLAWYYELDDLNVNSDSRIYSFCNSGWQKGFLRRYSQKVTQWWKCTDYTCETCQSEEGNWVLDRTTYGEMREDLLP